jgi:hypothetical protein
MGCGKSRHHSPDVSENDLKSQGSLKKDSKSSFSKNPKKKKRETDTNGETSQSTNNKNKARDGSNKAGTSPGISSSTRSAVLSSTSSTSSPLQTDSDKSSNGATKQQGSYYLLEVPNEIYTATSAKETSTRSNKDVKTGLKSAKCVHATSSQLEFFKMLDEKIEMGDDYETSIEVPETFSFIEATKH